MALFYLTSRQLKNNVKERNQPYKFLRNVFDPESIEKSDKNITF